jgi:hypothetical protein
MTTTPTADRPAAAPRADAGAPAALAGALELPLGVTFAAEVAGPADGGGWTVRAGGRAWPATPALSCLVEPEAGDRVLCCTLDGADGASCHVLAVLARPAGGALRLHVDGDLRIAARGALALSAGAEARVDAAAVAIETPRFDVHADEASLVSRSLNFVAETCAKTVRQLRVVGEQLTTVFAREAHHAQSHQRTVDGVDRLSAQVVEHEASALMQLRGENLLANGNRLVKVNGSQIHFG